MKLSQIIILILLTFCFKAKSQNVFNKDYNNYSHYNIYSIFDSFNNVPFYAELYNTDYFFSSLSVENDYIFIGGTENLFLVPYDSMLNSAGFYVKVDMFGDTIWQKEFKVFEKGFVEFYNALELENGNCFLMGIYGDSIYGPTVLGKVLLKIDSNGNELWHKTFDDFEREYFIDAFKINENSYYLLSSNYLDNDTVLPCITNIDSSGNEIWKKCYKDNVQNFPRCFIKVDSNIFISSLASGPVDLNENRVSLFKLDTLANKLDYFEYSDATSYYINNINEENLGYYKDENGLHLFLSGVFQDYIGVHSRGMILSIDINGLLEWMKIDSSLNEFSVYQSIKVLPKSNKIVCIGNTENHDQQGNPLSGDAVMFILMDLQGNVIVQKEINTNVEDQQYYVAYNVKETKDGGFLITGYSMDNQAIDEDSIFLRNNGWVLKTDSCGYSVGDIPKPMFVVDSVINNKDNTIVFITEKSTNYCSAVLDWGDGTEEKNYYAFENNKPLQEKHFEHVFTENGSYTLKTSTLAGEEHREYELTINLTGVGVNEITNNKNQITIFPNPAKDYFIIQNPTSVSNNPNTFPLLRGLGACLFTVKQGFKAQIKTPTGKTIKTITLDNRLYQQQINVSDLVNGVYFVSFTVNGEQIGVDKLVIAR